MKNKIQYILYIRKGIFVSTDQIITPYLTFSFPSKHTSIKTCYILAGYYYKLLKKITYCIIYEYEFNITISCFFQNG